MSAGLDKQWGQLHSGCDCHDLAFFVTCNAKILFYFISLHGRKWGKIQNPCADSASVKYAHHADHISSLVE